MGTIPLCTARNGVDCFYDIMDYWMTLGSRTTSDTEFPDIHEHCTFRHKRLKAMAGKVEAEHKIRQSLANESKEKETNWVYYQSGLNPGNLKPDILTLNFFLARNPTRKFFHPVQPWYQLTTSLLNVRPKIIAKCLISCLKMNGPKNNLKRIFCLIWSFYDEFNFK